MTQFLHLHLHNVNVLVDFIYRYIFFNFNICRFGIGRFTTEEEIDYTADLTIQHVTRLREMRYIIIVFVHLSPSHKRLFVQQFIREFLKTAFLLITIWRITYYYSILIRSFLKELSK